MFSDITKRAGSKGAVLIAVSVVFTSILPMIAVFIDNAVEINPIPTIVIALYVLPQLVAGIIITVKYPHWSTVGLMCLACLAGIIIDEIVWLIFLPYLAPFGYFMTTLGLYLGFLLLGAGLGAAMRALGAHVNKENPPREEDIRHLTVFMLTGKNLSAQEYSQQASGSDKKSVLGQAFSQIKPRPAILTTVLLLVFYPGILLIAVNNENLREYGYQQPVLYFVLPAAVIIFALVAGISGRLRICFNLMAISACVSLLTYIVPLGGEPCSVPCSTIAAAVIGTVIGLGIRSLIKRSQSRKQVEQAAQGGQPVRRGQPMQAAQR